MDSHRTLESIICSQAKLPLKFPRGVWFLPDLFTQTIKIIFKDVSFCLQSLLLIFLSTVQLFTLRFQKFIKQTEKIDMKGNSQHVLGRGFSLFTGQKIIWFSCVQVKREKNANVAIWWDGSLFIYICNSKTDWSLSAKCHGHVPQENPPCHHGVCPPHQEGSHPWALHICSFPSSERCSAQHSSVAAYRLWKDLLWMTTDWPGYQTWKGNLQKEELGVILSMAAGGSFYLSTEVKELTEMTVGNSSSD